MVNFHTVLEKKASKCTLIGAYPYFCAWLIWRSENSKKVKIVIIFRYTYYIFKLFRLHLNYSYIKNKWFFFFFLETLLCLVYTFWVQYHQKVGPWEVQKMSDTVELLHETDLVRSEKKKKWKRFITKIALKNCWNYLPRH